MWVCILCASKRKREKAPLLVRSFIHNSLGVRLYSSHTEIVWFAACLTHSAVCVYMCNATILCDDITWCSIICNVSYASGSVRMHDQIESVRKSESLCGVDKEKEIAASFHNTYHFLFGIVKHWALYYFYFNMYEQFFVLSLLLVHSFVRAFASTIFLSLGFAFVSHVFSRCYFSWLWVFELISIAIKNVVYIFFSFMLSSNIQYLKWKLRTLYANESGENEISKWMGKFAGDHLKIKNHWKIHYIRVEWKQWVPWLQSYSTAVAIAAAAFFSFSHCPYQLWTYIEKFMAKNRSL